MQLSAVENGQYEFFWRAGGRLRHDAKLGGLRVVLRARTDVASGTYVGGGGECERGVSASLRQIGARRWARAARPSLVGERNGQPRVQPFRCKGLLHLAVELAFDHHVDQPRTETRSPAPPGRGPAAFVPIEDEGEALLRARDRPGQHDAARRARKAAVLAGIGRKLVHRHAESEGRIRLEEDVGSAERDAVEERSEERVEKLAQRG